MRRNVTERMLAWKESPHRKPLIVRGARQTGKTYSMIEFGKAEYATTAYINFESNAEYATVFDRDLDPHRVFAELSILKGVSIVPGATLVIFDEIQACEKALTFLKYLNEEANEYHVMAAGSLLGLAMNRERYSFPVGKVDMLAMHPLSFGEFLTAMEEDALRDEIVQAAEAMSPLPQAMHEKALGLYRLYLSVGGYPEAVAMYAQTRDSDHVSAVQNAIADAYIADMAKYSTPSDTTKAIAAYNSLPAQLARENAKFMYSLIGSSARAKDYENALQWLQAAGVVIKCTKVTGGEAPLAVCEDPLSFKLYYSDVGLLSAKTGLPMDNIIHGMRVSTRMRGMLAENYVAQELVANGVEPHYWTLGGQAEVDFVIQTAGRVIPIEVKSAENVRARSLGMFRGKYRPETSVRMSTKNFGRENGILSIPLYAAFAFPAAIAAD